MTEWPTFPVAGWAETRPTLHRWTQIVGKIPARVRPARQSLLAQHPVRVHARPDDLADALRQ